MGRILVILAIAGALAVSAAWLALGANTGWTRMKIETKKIDPVTEIEFIEYTPGFIPGIDALAVGLGGCIFLLGVGWILSRHQSKTKTS
jgi:hypothetical protein